jgi:DNA-binding NarL/FixJ family response regulator
MSRRSADEISGSPELLRPRAVVPEMSGPERDRRIMELSARGWKPAQIGKAVGMSRQGVEAAIRRIRAHGGPGRVRAD